MPALPPGAGAAHPMPAPTRCCGGRRRHRFLGAGRPRPIRLLLGARRKTDLYDLPDLWRMEAEYPSLEIRTAVSGEPGYAGVRGRLPEVLARQLPPRGTDIYLSGPPAMVHKSVRVLRFPELMRWRIHADPAHLPG
jgi:NAD(P)H-flavin reductase